MIPDNQKKRSLQDVIRQKSRISAAPVRGLTAPARPISNEWIVIRARERVPSLRSVHQWCHFFTCQTNRSRNVLKTPHVDEARLLCAVIKTVFIPCNKASDVLNMDQRDFFFFFTFRILISKA